MVTSTPCYDDPIKLNVPVTLTAKDGAKASGTATADIKLKLKAELGDTTSLSVVALNGGFGLSNAKVELGNDVMQLGVADGTFTKTSDSALVIEMGEELKVSESAATFLDLGLSTSIDADFANGSSFNLDLKADRKSNDTLSYKDIKIVMGGETYNVGLLEAGVDGKVTALDATSEEGIRVQVSTLRGARSGTVKDGSGQQFGTIAEANGQLVVTYTDGTTAVLQ